MLKLRVRVSPAIRCSYCHDALAATAFSDCPRCCTCLHDSCWKEAGPCPTLGCVPPRPKPRLIVLLGEAYPRVMGIYLNSLISGALASFLCAGSALVVPVFARMYDEVGLCLPASSEFLVGVPEWVWWLLSILSLAFMALKDRWLRRSSREALNSFSVLLTLAAGVWIVVSLFSPGLSTCGGL